MIHRNAASAKPRPEDSLKPGARRLHEKSASRLREPVVATKMKRLQQLLRADKQAKLRLGDVLVELIDEHELRFVDLSRQLKEQANHLNEFYHVAKMFPPNVRRPQVPYNHYLMAMRCVRRFRKLALDPLATLQEITSTGLTQHRAVTNHFSDKQRSSEAEAALAKAAMEDHATWLNRCIHADCRRILNQVPDRSCKVIHVDPPYACYRKVADGRYAGGSATRLDCDNKTGTEAVKLTADLLHQWGRKLTNGGVLLLWQAAGPLRKQIMSAIERCGWEVEAVVVWDKGSVQPGNFSNPYSTRTEWLWVLKRAGDVLVNHDASSRSDLISFPPVHHLRGATERYHAFEKPLELCRFLVSKHSYPGEIVVDLCACSGSMALAAAGMGRRWLYVESNAANFRIGRARLYAADSKAAS